MNTKLATVARQRAEQGLGERKPGYCQRWVRQCLESVYGKRYGPWMRASAKHTAAEFLRRVPKGAKVISSSRVEDTRLGDLLYSTRGEFGHVSIRVLGNRVAENSSTHNGPNGAIGFRSLFTVHFDIIVRLPEE